MTEPTAPTGSALNAPAPAPAPTGPVPTHPTAGIVTVVGSTNADVTATMPRLPGPGETLLGTSLVTSPGGKGANQALAASRCGASVRFVGAVGDDDAAGTALSLLRADGVDLSRVQVRPDAPTGTALIWVEDSAENSIVVISGANATVTARDVENAAQDRALEGVVVLQGEIPAASVARAAELALGRVVLNLAPVIELPAPVLRRADPLIVNEHEATETLHMLHAAPNSQDSHPLAQAPQPHHPTLGTSASVPHPAAGDTHPAAGDTQHAATAPRVADSPSRDGQPASEAAGEQDERGVVGGLVAAGVRSVVLTLGARGALVGDADGIRSVPAAPVSAVDTTGAGDAFVGACAARLAAGDTLDDAARHASRFAAAAVLTAGTQNSYPHADAQLPELG